MDFDDWARSRLNGLLGFAMVLCCDRGIAEDTVQDVLIKILRRWDRISRLESPDDYARRMIVNQYAGSSSRTSPASNWTWPKVRR